MPEPREREDMEEQEFAPPPAKKKKSWKGMFFLLLLLTATGAAAGMHISGAWDARPLIYGTVPKIPWVGEDIARITGIPGEYSLTAEERRRLELQRWSERLEERERRLRERDEELKRLAADLEARALSVEKKETELEMKRSKLPESPEEEKAYVDMLMRTYQEISPRRAALILEQLREDLAVKMLLAMPPDARASILGRMDAVRAARLTERLAAGGSR